MALDTRDYWKRKWNKRTGYVEKAEFRLSALEVKRKRFRRAWRQAIFKWAAIFLLIFALLHVLKMFLRG